MTKISALLAIAILGFSTHVTAQSDFPSKPIQLIVGWPAGGTTDVLARTLAQEAKKILGREVIVVNKPGATGSLGAMYVAAAQPDGYTLGVMNSATCTTAHFLQNIPSDIIERNTALVWLGRPQQAIAVRRDSPISSVKDLIEQARRNPGKVTIGLQGTGSATGLLIQAIALEEEAEMGFVPFQGEAPAVTALLGGHITSVASAITAFDRHVASGELRTIASMNEHRLQSDPNVPTLIEQGFPYKIQTIFFLHGPKGLPATVTERLVDVFGRAARTAAYIDVTTKNGIVTSNPVAGEALERFLIEDRARTGAIVKKLGLKKG